MFSPSQLPCTAWVVLKSLALREVDVVTRLSSDGVFYDSDGSFLFSEDMFATRAEAVAEARGLLVVSESRLLSLQKRVDARRRAVARLLDEPAVGGVEGGAA